ncbi:MAG: hypothetical protein ABSF77_11050 [Spirochaetia bacterium]
MGFDRQFSGGGLLTISLAALGAPHYVRRLPSVEVVALADVDEAAAPGSACKK